MSPIRYETLTQAAERTGISTVTLRRRIATGQLRVYRAGRRIIRLRPEDVDPAPDLSRWPSRPQATAMTQSRR